jgi:hypothetical protein
LSAWDLVVAAVVFGGRTFGAAAFMGDNVYKAKNDYRYFDNKLHFLIFIFFLILSLNNFFKH